MTQRFEINDDSGFLALVDPDAYRGFVAADWDLDSLFSHLGTQMAARSLLIWGTGREEQWQVDVLLGPPLVPAGFRQVSGPIRVSAGRLLLTGYESLTMAAQFADVTLPEKHTRDQVVGLPSGDYTCTVVQLADPDDDTDDDRTGPDFVVALTPGGTAEPWTTPQWFAM